MSEKEKIRKEHMEAVGKSISEYLDRQMGNFITQTQIEIIEKRIEALEKKERIEQIKCKHEFTNGGTASWINEKWNVSLQKEGVKMNENEIKDIDAELIKLVGVWHNFFRVCLYALVLALILPLIIKYYGKYIEWVIG